MRIHILTITATTVPLCSALAMQGVLGDLFDAQNPLDDALESSPNFTPAEVLDSDIDIDEYTSINPNDVDTWIKNFLSQPIDEITNVPSDLVDLDLDAANNPHHSDKTIYQLISDSKYTTILAKIIDEDRELVEYLNSTDHKFTFFAPTDYAFCKIPHRHRHRHHDNDNDNGNGDDDHRIPKEVIRAILRYHSSPEVLNSAKLFHSHTIPSALDDPLLGTRPSSNKDKEGLPQRLTVRAGFKGLTLNFHSHIIAPDMGASNGLIHGLDSILLPPPRALLLLDILPTIFSTFNLALYKTSLTSHLNTTTQDTAKGFTVFAPSNSAFQHLGLRINAFLFSPPGLPYLRALLKYHVVPEQTMYSDVLYRSGGVVKLAGVEKRGKEVEEEGLTHLDLPTLLGDRAEIAVDVAHFGPFVSFKVNGWQRVGFADVLGRDGVIHVLDHVLIPPRRVESGGGAAVPPGKEDGGVELEDLMERLGPWVDEEDGVDFVQEEVVGGRATEL